ncbi:glycosyltransferase [Actinomadura sp. 1N219]|uniref:glycosyltransferase n=1 Tax=Actinomadura sp. 1N219 TaxID=3375152 RepID=UPI0037980B12
MRECPVRPSITLSTCGDASPPARTAPLLLHPFCCTRTPLGAAELGVGDAVTLTGAVPPTDALRRMREHDVLVHPSRGETFGVAVVEAVAAGLPVLVTRCGGPQVTLAGVEDAAGEMIDVDDDPETIAAGYRRLHVTGTPLARGPCCPGGRCDDLRSSHQPRRSAHSGVWSRRAPDLRP